MEERGLIAGNQIDLGEIIKRVAEGERAILLIDGDHWIPLTGFDGENVFYNNPSKEETELNRSEKIEKFIKKWSRFNLNTVLILKKNNGKKIVKEFWLKKFPPSFRRIGTSDRHSTPFQSEADPPMAEIH